MSETAPPFRVSAPEPSEVILLRINVPSFKVVPPVNPFVLKSVRVPLPDLDIFMEPLNAPLPLMI